jgi:hypothetical protein
MMAAGSSRPSRSKKAARTGSGKRIMVVWPVLRHGHQQRVLAGEAVVPATEHSLAVALHLAVQLNAALGD